MLPSTFRIVRSISIAQTPQTLFAFMSNLHRFHEWSPWQHLDPNMKRVLAGTPGQIGSSHSWHGNSKAGEGSMTITSLESPQKIEIDLNFIKPFKSSNKTIWQIEDLGQGQSKVTWIMTGELTSFFHKLFALLAMNRLVGKDFEKGLAKVKAVLEKKSN